MSEPLTSERRAALRARAEEAQGRIGNWGPAVREAIQTEAQDLLDLLAALETAETERDQRAEDFDRALAELKALRPDVAGTPLPGSREAVIVYTNWRGETAERRIIPRSIWFGSTEWHRDEQYLLRAWDVEKGAVRDFALRDVREWREGADQR